MKLRTGFVTNSSSSSFTIAKSNLTADQIDKIKNHIEAAKELVMISGTNGALQRRIAQFVALLLWTILT